MDEIEAAIASLTEMSQKGSRRDGIAPRLRGIPAGRKAVIAFTIDDDAREVHIHAVTYAGADWIRHRKASGRKCTPRAANETSATKQPSAVVQSSRPNQIGIS
ncbi:type II toxin-antitoxin system RelE/ParE family toxin [Litoreibacter arenae]|uniref:type II toxin-antitoxin system RelE/ParE family toxin n=1 Tax=Litoreibacter arenae TaxID=491388 RepID=UPI0005940F41|nr:type II toxin-antitoxin system RelE/ParE family toxin [Litoreibacter arenae]